MLLPNYHTSNSSWGHQCILLTTNLTFNNGSVGEVLFHRFTEGDIVEQRGISRLFRKIKGMMFYPSLSIQAFIERVFKDMRRWTTPVFHLQVWSGVFWTLTAGTIPTGKKEDTFRKSSADYGAWQTKGMQQSHEFSSPKGSFQNCSHCRMWNNLNLRQMMATPLGLAAAKRRLQCTKKTATSILGICCNTTLPPISSEPNNEIQSWNFGFAPGVNFVLFSLLRGAQSSKALKVATRGRR